MPLRPTALVALLVALHATRADPAPAAPRARGGAVSVEPQPSWALPAEPDADSEFSPDEASDGVHYLLLDRQVRVSGASRELYAHYSKQIVSEAGLEDSSQVSVSFEPSYQRLRLHAVRVRRGGAWLNRLAPSRLELIQREPELERQVFDGRRSAVLFVEDLRVGDVLDYSYTIEGANPVFEGRYFDSFAVEWSVPVQRLRQRLLWPRGRPLYVRNRKTTLSPQRRELAGSSELTWEKRHVEGIADEARVPGAYETHGWVQLSELESWDEVAAWGERLFRVPRQLPAELQAQLEGWRRATSEPAARVVLAARFVQDEIRYVGIEIGAGSHRPAAPDAVAARRYGDCKDKALLLVTLLRGLGIEADPALVHTQSGSSLDEWQPSPLAFNHVVVRVALAGAEHWLDATLASQGGALGAIHFPSYERALVLSAHQGALTVLPAPRLPRPTTLAHETFLVQQLDGPVEYSVETRYEGGDADSRRAGFQRETREQTARGYLDYYAQRFPNIRQAAPLELQDDREKNLLVTRERYAIQRLPADAADPKRVHAELHAVTLDDAIGKLASPRRFAPLAVEHPVRVRHVTEVMLPDEHSAPPDSAAVQTDAVRFSYRAGQARRTLKLEYEYETLARAVPAADVPRHVAALGRVRKRLLYGLRWPPLPDATAHGPGLSWPLLATLGSFLPLLLLGGLKLYRRRRAPGAAAARDPALAGIRGGLLLVALALLQLSFLILSDAREWLGACLTADWRLLTTPGALRYHALWEPFLTLRMLTNLLELGALLLAWVFFLSKRRGFPAVLVGLAALHAAALFCVTLVGQALPQRHAEIGSIVSGAFLMLLPVCAVAPYAILSDRSRSTFVA